MKILPLFILPHIHDNTRCVGPPPLILHASHNLRPASFLPHRRRQLHLSLILPLRRQTSHCRHYVYRYMRSSTVSGGGETPAYYLLQSEISAIEEDYTSSSTVIKDDVSASGETRGDDARPSPSTVHAYVEVGPDRTRVLGPKLGEL